MMKTDIAPIVKRLEVARSPADAFRIFTAEIGAWWPRDTHTRAKAAEGERSIAVAIEPRVGGRVFETMDTGRECDWGEVLTFEPGREFAMTWRLRGDPLLWSRVTVRFEPAGAGCAVVLTHDHWETYGDDAAPTRDNYDRGWAMVFSERFAGAVA